MSEPWADHCPCYDADRLTKLEAAADDASQYIEEHLWGFAFTEGMKKVVFCNECRGIREHGHTADCKANKIIDALAAAREGKS